MRQFFAFLLILCLAIPASQAQNNRAQASRASVQAPPAVAYETDAPVAFMRDLSSGQILFERDADRQIPPASMAKMMTVYVAFKLVAEGEIALTDTVTVSEATWSEWNNRGSTMFLGVGDEVTISDLLHGIVTLSGNDACVVLAEGLAGSEAAFVDLMNQSASDLGMADSRFGNSNGWPDEGATLVTARDLATLAEQSYRDFPELYEEFYGQDSFEWNGITQPNRNPLIGAVEGADGLKTGHTEEAGYGFTGSAEQDGRRIVMVLAGLDSYSGRIAESVRFMNWGFRAWRSEPLFSGDAVVGQVPVQMGSERSVNLVTGRDLAITVPRSWRGDMAAEVVYQGPVKAPFDTDTPIAELRISGENMVSQRFPLFAETAAEEAGFFARMWNGFLSLFG